MPRRSWKESGRAFVAPVGRGIAAAGISADAVTITGLLFAAGCGMFLAVGEGRIAAVFLVASALCDLLDGAVARARGGGTSFGAALDSTVDRYGEALILGGVLIDATVRGAEAGLLWLWIAALSGSFLTSYVRARAEGLGLRCDVGLMERPHRLVLLGILCLLGPPAVPVLLGVLAVGSHITFVQRLLLIRREGRSGRPAGG
ncbi:MAG: CDP-alcohol phosphatidyltransferase family protein [Candidatus Eisenbacteria bacterium]|nr:CDP-alcohol phosphatidyltransferase family protein [Candidatus Latescibacterota bacterium]MBD3301757.1 CDP-alcohol phosphatidyltransferase family protein [Candidatus Eisenbacteria bacterium]